MGEVEVWFESEELGFPICIGEITVTECEMVAQFEGGRHVLPQFDRGYGLTLGHGERKAMALALLDRAPQHRGVRGGDVVSGPGSGVCHVSLRQCGGFAGFVQHLRLHEQTKRMIRRVILKATATPGYQVPFGGREMPLTYGRGTGDIQVTASILGCR